MDGECLALLSGEEHAVEEVDLRLGGSDADGDPVAFGAPNVGPVALRERRHQVCLGRSDVEPDRRTRLEGSLGQSEAGRSERLVELGRARVALDQVRFESNERPAPRTDEANDRSDQRRIGRTAIDRHGTARHIGH